MENFGKDNVVALKSSPNMITVFNGKKTMTKIESVHGRIVRLNLYDHAKKLIYITESGSVVLYNISTEQSDKILQLDSIDNFIDILQVQGNFMVICKGDDSKLQVIIPWLNKSINFRTSLKIINMIKTIFLFKIWKNLKISQSLENSEKVISIYKMSENCAMTVSTDGNIKYWIIENFEWREIYKHKINDVAITHCCLSKLKCFLAVVDKKKKLDLYRISDIDSKNFYDFKVDEVMSFEYKEIVSICQFSEDDKYLAVALDNGDISVSGFFFFFSKEILRNYSCFYKFFFFFLDN